MHQLYRTEVHEGIIPLEAALIGDQKHTECKRIYAEVKFGQPSTRCRGAGICRVDLYQYHGRRNLQAHQGCARAIAILEYRGGSIKLRFSRYSVCKYLTKKYFEKGWIRLREPVMLPESLCSVLKQNALYFSSGKYGIEKEGHYYVVTLPTSKDQSVCEKGTTAQ